jgi:hypothetical protein
VQIFSRPIPSCLFKLVLTNKKHVKTSFNMVFVLFFFLKNPPHIFDQSMKRIRQKNRLINVENDAKQNTLYNEEAWRLEREKMREN